MRWTSATPAKSEGEPTVLAIAESVLAVAISIWVAVHFHTVKHIAVGACVAPFLLLRTERSVELGWRLWVGMDCTDRLRRAPTRLHRFLLKNIETVLFVAGFHVARVLAAVVTLVRSPIASISAMPSNWRTVVLSLDLRRSPELIPVPRVIAVEGKFFDRQFATTYELVRVFHSRRERAAGWLKAAGRLRGPLLGLLIAVMWVLVLLVFCLPAFLYRYSLKATALVWFPVLWACKSFDPSADSLATRVRLFLRSDIQRWARLSSAFAVVVTTAKVACAMARLKTIELVSGTESWLATTAAGGVLRSWLSASEDESTPLGRFLRDLVAPDAFPRWQIALFANSVLLLGQWLWLREVDRRFEAGATVPEARVEWTFGATQFVRRLLSAYTIACTLYFASRIAFELPWPPLGEQWFPWSAT